MKTVKINEDCHGNLQLIKMATGLDFKDIIEMLVEPVSDSIMPFLTEKRKYLPVVFEIEKLIVKPKTVMVSGQYQVPTNTPTEETDKKNLELAEKQFKELEGQNSRKSWCYENE